MTAFAATPARRARTLPGLRNLVLGTIAGLTPVTAVVLLGWIMRMMGRQARLAAGVEAPPPPGWVMGPPGQGRFARALGGFAANIRDGVTALVALAIGTAPFAGLWAVSWYAGWNNSFTKGYEQAGFGPLVGILGVLAFAILMIWLPTAQAHMATERRLSAFFDFARIRSAVRYSGWSTVGWALALMALALPILGARALPVFAEDIIPGFASFGPEEVQALRGQMTLAMAAYVFVAVALLRRWQARIYGRAAARAMTGQDADIWTGSALIPAGTSKLGQARAPFPPFRLLRAVLQMAIWIIVAFVLFFGQFMNHDWLLWLNHPLIGLPWMV